MFQDPLPFRSALSSLIIAWLSLTGCQRAVESTAVTATTTQALATLTQVEPTTDTSMRTALNGLANPQGSASYAYFRVRTTGVSTCIDSDAWGARKPALASDDISLGSGTSDIGFAYNSSDVWNKSRYFICTFVRNATGVAMTPTPRLYIPVNPNDLFDWAQVNYPTQFPTPSPTTQFSYPYTYRTYASTGNYIGVANGDIFMSGPIVGTTSIVRYDSIANYACQVYPSACGPFLTLGGLTAVQGSTFSVSLANGVISPNGNVITIQHVTDPDGPPPLIQIVATNTTTFNWYPTMSPSWSLGAYEFRYYVNGANTATARSGAFTLTSPPTFSLTTTAVTQGAPAPVSLSSGDTSQSGNRFGVAKVGTSDSTNLATSPAGGTNPTWSPVMQSAWGTGQFEFRYYLGASNTVTARSQPFTVSIALFTPPQSPVALGTPVSIGLSNGSTTTSNNTFGLAKVGSPDTSNLTIALAPGSTPGWVPTLDPSWTTGSYEFRYYLGGSTTVLARSAAFTVVQTQITLGSTTVRQGAVADVTLANGSTTTSGNTLALQRVGGPDNSFLTSVTLNAQSSYGWMPTIDPAWGTGQFEIRYYVSGNNTPLARSQPFTVVLPPAVTASATSVPLGSPITATLANGNTQATGNFLAIARVGAAQSTYLASSSAPGSSGTWSPVIDPSWGTGQYEFRYYEAGVLVVTARSQPITVVAQPALSRSPATLTQNQTVTATLANGFTGSTGNRICVAKVGDPDSTFITGVTADGATGTWSPTMIPSWGSGQFEFRYYLGASTFVSARSAAFTVQPLPAALTIDATSVPQGTPVTMHLTNGNTTTNGNWLGLARVGSADSSFLTSTVAVGATIDWVPDFVYEWGPGSYEYRYYLSASTTVTARSPSFTVTAVTRMTALSAGRVPPSLAISAPYGTQGSTFSVTLANGSTETTNNSIGLAVVGSPDATFVASTSSSGTSTVWNPTLAAAYGVGQFEFRYYTNGGTLSARSPQFTVIGPGDPPPTSVIKPTTAAGKTEVEVDVSTVGSARMTIPLRLPPGVGDVKPELSLEYDGRGGDSAFGMGWRLSQLSVITRCNKSLASDGDTAAVTMTAADRFCIDGQPLKLTGGTYGVAGSSYATELEAFSKIVANGTQGNGPASFTVTSKNGLVLTFGTNGGFAPRGTGTIRTWILSQVADRTGNRAVFTYDNTRESAPLLSTIDYPYTATGQGPFSQVAITYETRPNTDRPARYLAGELIQDVYRAMNILVRQQGTLIKSYNLIYEQGPVTKRSVLTAVQECSATTCLAPSILRYGPGASGYSASTVSGSSVAAVTGTIPGGINSLAGRLVGSNKDFEQRCEVLSGDFNGDGKTDLLYATKGGTTAINGAYCDWKVRLSTGSGYGPDVSLGVVTALNVNVYGRRPFVGNFTGSSTTEILIPVNGGGTYNAEQPSNFQVLAYNAGSNAFVARATNLSYPAYVPANWEGASLSVGWGYVYVVQVADLDGNGLTDLVWCTRGTNGRTATVNVSFSYNQTAVGGTVTFSAKQLIAGLGLGDQLDSVSVMHFDDDGIDDLVVRTLNYGTTSMAPLTAYTYLAKINGPNRPVLVPAALSEPVVANGTLQGVQIIDWNGDGCEDYVSGATVALSNCTDSFAPSVTLPVTIDSSMNALPLDLDGDGRKDLAYRPAPGSNFNVLRSTGMGVEAPVATVLPASTGCTRLDTFAVDLDGDGQVDVGTFCFNSGTAAPFPVIYPHLAGAVPADVVTTVTDGFGIASTFSYASLAKDAAYTKGTGATYPELDINPALTVVSGITQSDGIGGTYQLTCSYAGARSNLWGRGFEGFQTRSLLDSRDNTLLTETYATAFPLTGMMTRRVLSRGGTPMLDWSGTPQTQVLGSGVEQRTFAFLGSEVTSTYEVGGAKNGVLITRETVNRQYTDGYGNPTRIDVTTTDLDFSGSSWTSSTVSSYVNDTSTWCLGLPQTETVTATAAGEPALTRSRSYGRDGTTCRHLTLTEEPGDPLLSTTTTFGYDGCGNSSSSSVVGRSSTGAALPARTRSISFGTRCQLPESTTDELGQQTSLTYFYGFGVVASSTDENVLSTSFLIDDYGRTTKVTRPDGTSTTYTYDTTTCAPLGSGLKLAVAQAHYGSDGVLGSVATECRDALGRPRISGTIHPRQTVYTYDDVRTYDAKGRVARIERPYTPGVSSNGYRLLQYDSANRVTSDAAYKSDNTLFAETTYRYLGRTTEITDPRHFTTSTVTDVWGLPRFVTEPSPGGTTTYDYDSLRHLRAITDAAGKKSSFVSNVFGFHTSQLDADTGAATYSVNTFGEVTHVVDAKNQAFDYGYDALGRMTSRVELEGTTTWVWGTSTTNHNRNRLESVSGLGTSEAYLYDAFARLSRRSVTTDQTYAYNLSYNTQGLLDTVLYPNNGPGLRLGVKHTYHQRSLVQLEDSSSGALYWRANTFNDDNAITSQTVGNTTPTTVTRTFLPHSGKLRTLQAGVSGQLANRQDHFYDWDEAGNLTLRQDVLNGVSQVFGYDSMGRLSTSTRNGVLDLTVSLAANGNITSRSDLGAYTYDAVHPHGVASAGGTTWTYDANGNVSTRNGQAQVWASFNLPTTLRDPTGLVSTFQYGPNHERVKQVANFPSNTETTQYLGGLLERVQGTGAEEWRHLIPTPGGVKLIFNRSVTAAKLQVVVEDLLGSTTSILSDATGALVVGESFSQYGARRAGWGWAGTPTAGERLAYGATTRMGFGGHPQLDNQSLVHLGARVYDPNVGRFLSADPQLGSTPQAHNPYSYVSNRPLSLVDPSGESEEILDFTNITQRVEIIGVRPTDAPPLDVNSYSSSLFGRAGNVFARGYFDTGYSCAPERPWNDRNVPQLKAWGGDVGESGIQHFNNKVDSQEAMWALLPGRTRARAMLPSASRWPAHRPPPPERSGSAKVIMNGSEKLYRGVAPESPLFEAAKRGVAEADARTEYTNQQGYYSYWTTSLAEAEKYAGPNGVVLVIDPKGMESAFQPTFWGRPYGEHRAWATIYADEVRPVQKK